MSVLDILAERGFIQQCINQNALEKLMGNSSITYYAGFDPTADSLHIGSLMPIMAMSHLQKAGHRPIAIIGGGTAMIGDPSGKTEMRKFLTAETVESNGKGILAQLQRYLNIDSNSGIFLNNADWLLTLNYISFLRDIGRFFKVNEMIKAESYRMRLEREEGLSFIEFNYQLLQAYDFLKLFQEYKCVLQVGGDDQWGNILAGVDLTRRVESTTVFGLTFPLLTTARGNKMGKTEKGTVWLDAKKTSPYEFYQYWINTDDRDVERFLAYFTFLPIDEVRRLGKLQDKDIRHAKEVLAFEVTKLAHGEEEAKKAQDSSKAAFGGESTNDSVIPTIEVDPEKLKAGVSIIDFLVELNTARGRGEARRLIQQGGISINGDKITSEIAIDLSYVRNNRIDITVGKKRHYKITVTGGQDNERTGL